MNILKLPRIYRVDGDSMEPNLSHDDYVLAIPYLPLRVGKMIVLRHRTLGVIVKRICHVNEDKTVLVQGDSPLSSSTEQMGIIEPRDILGTVVKAFRK